MTPEGIQIARIEDVPYRGLGFVFEKHQGPPLERIDSDSNREIEFCAIFWANVSP